MDDLTCLLDHRCLIDSHRNSSSLESCDIGRLADRVCEEAHRSTLLVLIFIIIAL